MLKISRKIVQDNQDVNEDIIEDSDNQVVDAENFKGIYYNENTEQRFYEHGAHFPFRLLCKKLQKIACSQEIKNRNSSVGDRNSDKTRNSNVLNDNRIRNFSLTTNTTQKKNDKPVILNALNTDAKSRNNTNNKYSSLDKDSKNKVLAFTRVNNLTKINNNTYLTQTQNKRENNKFDFNKNIKSESIVNSTTSKNNKSSVTKQSKQNGPNLKILSNIKTRNNFSRDKNLPSNPNSFAKSFNNNNKENSTLSKLENVKRSLSKSMNEKQINNKSIAKNKNENVIRVITNMKYIKPFNNNSSKYTSNSVARNNQTSNNSKTSATSSTKNKDRLFSKGSILTKEKIKYSIKSRNQSGYTSISKTKNDSVGKSSIANNKSFGLKSFSTKKNNLAESKTINNNNLNNLTNNKSILDNKSKLSISKQINDVKTTVSNKSAILSLQKNKAIIQSNLYVKAPKNGIIIEDNTRSNTGKESVSKFET